MKPLMRLCARSSAAALLIAASSSITSAAPGPSITLNPVGSYASGIFNAGGAEIAAHDPTTQRLYVINALDVTVDVLSISDPATPTRIASIDFSAAGASANSVAVKDGIVAVAVEAFVKTDPGWVVLMDQGLNTLNVLQVGALPDMLTFSPNGRWLLVANEGEPNSYGMPDSVDPEGSVSIVDLSGGAANVTQANVRTADFTAFNVPAVLDPRIRIYGPGATVAQDLEPESIAVSFDSRTAWVTLQENNAMATIDLASATVTQLTGLGFKDHNVPGAGLDASDRDGNNNIVPWPVKGMYQPDAIAAYMAGGQTFLVMANEGDAREWPGFGATGTEIARVSSLQLDPAAFPDATLQADAKLGRLQVTTTLGDANGDGLYEELYALGGRSFSIRDTDGNLIFDSGDQFEQITAMVFPTRFNASNSGNTRDARSPAKGPEPEGVTVGKAFGRTYAFVALERIGGVMAYDVTNPYVPTFEFYINRRDLAVSANATNFALAGDLGPEGIIFIKAEDSPNGRPLVVVANEISGTTTILEVSLNR